MRVLIVEDDPLLGDALAAGLKQRGFEADWVTLRQTAILHLAGRCRGEPHIVKVSWFPNWKVEGAKGPWMLSPGLMVVVPTQSEVRLSYRDTPVDLAGKALTVAGVGALLTPTVLGRWRARRRKGP